MARRDPGAPSQVTDLQGSRKPEEAEGTEGATGLRGGYVRFH